MKNITQYTTPIAISLFLVANALSAGEKEARAALKRATDFARSKDLIHAGAEFKNAIGAAPDNGKYYAEYGRFLYKEEKNYKDAINQYALAEAKGFKLPWIYRHRGLCYSKLKNLPEAESDLNQSWSVALEGFHAGEKRSENDLLDSAQALMDLDFDLEKQADALAILHKAREKVPTTDHTSFLTTGERIAESMAHISFGAEDFDMAIAHLEEARHLADANLKNKNQAKLRNILNTEMEIFRRRKESSNVTPIYTYKIHVMFVPRTKVELKSLLNGETARGEETLTELQRKRTRWLLAAFARYWEALTDGKIRVEYDFADIDTTLISLDQRISKNERTSGGEIREINPATSFSPVMDSIYNKYYRDTDSFIFIWNGTGVATYANGGSRYYPIGENKTIRRGFVHIAAGRFDNASRPQLFLHEMFHNIESMTHQNLQIDGSPTSKKRDFPACPVEEELDFFKCHFDRTLPGLLSSGKYRENGWRNLNYRLQYPASGIVQSREVEP